MSPTATANETNTSSHPYAGLENADTNSASWFDFREVNGTEDFESESDWHKTHKQTFYRLLDQHNRGYRNGDRRNSPFYTYQSNLHLGQALSGTLGLTNRQRSKAENWFRLLDFQKLGHPAEISGICICARIVHESDQDKRKCHPQTPIENWPNEFRDMYRSLGKRYQGRYEKVYGQIDYRIRNWSFSDDKPASESMDRYGSYEARLHHSSDRNEGMGTGVFKPSAIRIVKRISEKASDREILSRSRLDV